MSYLRVFRCLGWRHIPKDLRKKLDAKSERDVVIACMENSLYKLWIRGKRKAVISRDVTIEKNTFGAKGYGEGWVNG